MSRADHLFLCDAPDNDVVEYVFSVEEGMTWHGQSYQEKTKFAKSYLVIYGRPQPAPVQSLTDPFFKEHEPLHLRVHYRNEILPSLNSQFQCPSKDSYLFMDVPYCTQTGRAEDYIWLSFFVPKMRASISALISRDKRSAVSRSRAISCRAAAIWSIICCCTDSGGTGMGKFTISSAPIFHMPTAVRALD